MRSWSLKESAELYQVANWGAGFFGINDKGHVQVTPRGGPRALTVDLYELLPSLQARGLKLPLLVRFSDIVSASRARHREGLRQGDRRLRATRVASAASTRSR